MALGRVVLLVPAVLLVLSYPVGPLGRVDPANQQRREGLLARVDLPAQWAPVGLVDLPGHERLYILVVPVLPCARLHLYRVVPASQPGL